MKKFMVFTLASVLLALNGFAQLNPVNNLEWDHWYVMPNNYFILSWDEPDPSEDTLMGYHVYRENDLYCFTTELSLYHTPSASNCGEDFVAFGWGTGFSIHVTALYNSTLEESGYTETVYCEGFLIGIDTNKDLEQETVISPNPTNGMVRINLEKLEKVDVFSQSGELELEAIKSKILDLSALPKGVYFLRMETAGQLLIQKVLLY